MAESLTKTISPELYWGLLFAEQDAGGCLIPGRYSRNPEVNSGIARTVSEGLDQCGCIHGAAYLVGGPIGHVLASELSSAGIDTAGFDRFAEKEIAYGFCVTVESTLDHFGVTVREEAANG